MSSIQHKTIDVQHKTIDVTAMTATNFDMAVSEIGLKTRTYELRLSSVSPGEEPMVVTGTVKAGQLRDLRALDVDGLREMFVALQQEMSMLEQARLESTLDQKLLEEIKLRKSSLTRLVLEMEEERLAIALLEEQIQSLAGPLQKES